MRITVGELKQLIREAMPDPSAPRRERKPARQFKERPGKIEIATARIPWRGKDPDGEPSVAPATLTMRRTGDGFELEVSGGNVGGRGYQVIKRGPWDDAQGAWEDALVDAQTLGRVKGDWTLPDVPMG